MKESAWSLGSVVKFHLSLAAAVLSVHCLSASAQSAAADQRLGAVEEFESDSFDLDRSANTMIFDGFRILGDNWSLTADSATASADELDFEAGEWRFDGNIFLQLDTATLEAQSAVFAFREKRLVHAELTGDPVVFEDLAALEDRAAQGSALTLSYDDAAGTFELLGSVSLTVGPYLTTGCDLVYYLGEEEFRTGSAQCDEPFRTIIVPQESASTPVE